ncbi:MAG: hypothetical protein K2K35_03365, partial [Lachnospiraceae bacterium]|nr:hypothetical protein [Lachnospiraceae bacterium]
IIQVVLIDYTIIILGGFKIKTTAGLNFVNVKKNSKEEDFKNYSFMVQDIAGILTSLYLEAVIVEIYKYSGTQKEKADIIKRICASFSDNGEKKFVICTKAYASTEEFPESKYYNPGNVQGEVCDGKKPVPFDEIIRRESCMLEDIGFAGFNFIVGYENSKAFVYVNDIGKLVLDYSLNYQDK